MNRQIVVTTIFQPSPAIKAFAHIADNEGWTLLIVGDKKTPHDAYKKLEDEYDNVKYYHPDEQEKQYPEYSAFLGWNCSSRRNLGFIEAYNSGAEVLAMVDDDNVPLKGWGKDLAVTWEQTADVWDSYKNSQTLCFDTVWPVASNYTSCDNVIPWHRGFPLELLHDRCFTLKEQPVRSKFLVQANLWMGNPDVDAIERLTMDFDDVPPVSIDELSNYTAEQLGWRHYSKYWTFTHAFSPFNSQNTFLSRKAIPSYLLLREAGRVNDIWGAYLLQKELGPGNVCFANPTVWQQRNDHNLMKDFKDEVYGTLNVLELLLGDDILTDTMKRHVELYKKQFKQ